MNRLDVVQHALNHRRGRTYLEIGVKKGKVFLNVRVPKKLAVDPVLKVSLKRKMRSWVRYPYNLLNEYFAMTSDDFFTRCRDRLRRLQGIDVVFIDGLHTYEQTWKDVVNSLEYLRPQGVIVMHDCSPATETQATPADSHEHAHRLHAAPRAEDWSGDVWKTIVRLRSEREDLRVRVLDCDHGVGVIIRGEPEERLGLAVRDIEAMGYADLQKNRARLLGLHAPSELRMILGD
jgi:hypothetical protein